MALVASKTSDELKKMGYVRLYGDEVIDHSAWIIREWEPKSDTHFLRYGNRLLYVLAAVPGALLSIKYRNVHKLFGRQTLLLPTAALAMFVPAVVTNMVTYKLQRDFIVESITCPVCLEIRGVCTQMVTGIFVPWLCATTGFTQYMYSSGRVTFMPFSKDFFKWYYQLTVKSRPILLANAALQAGALSLVVYMWFREWFYINTELHSREEAYEKL